MKVHKNAFRVLCVFLFSQAVLLSCREGTEFSPGNVSFVIPGDFVGIYHNGTEDKVVHVHNREFTGKGYIKIFNVLFFRKDGDFEDDWVGYGVKNLPALVAYINGTSDEKPGFSPASVNSMRRNTLNGINVCETLTLSKFVIDDSEFSYGIIFVDDEYCYVVDITFWGSDFKAEIRRRMPDHFNGNDWILEKLNEIYDRFENFREMPEYMEALFDEAGRVFDTISFAGE